MDLSGTWRALVADDELRRTWQDADDDGSSWEPITVPGHWRSTPAFAATDGPLLYRTRFEAARPAEGDRAWLTFDGCFYQSDIWLDGAYVGDTEGYFFGHTLEVTDQLADRTEHTLGVELACPRPGDRTAKRALTGVFQHWDCLDPDWNPGGIWRPVRLERSGPVRIRHLRVLCREATTERAVVEVRAVLDAAAAGPVIVRTEIGTIDHQATRTLAAGENQITWTVTVPDPALWWPHALGDQPLHDVTVMVLTGSGQVSPSEERASATNVTDSRRLRIGLRRVELRNWIASVNGERLFLKGSNQGPTRMALAEATPTELRRDVDLAVEAGLDLLRIHAHVTRPELYDAADEAGLLLWQDMPLQWGYARTVRKEAVRQAREAVDMLGHHPSVAIWCGHNEPLALDVDPGGGGGDTSGLVARFIAGQELPTWNKTILDRSIKRALRKHDGTRPVIAHSGVLPHPPTLDGTDSHLYFGWYHGDERDLPGVARVMPRLVRFVTEFGAQAVPESDDFLEPQRWPDLDWERLGRTHALQKAIFDRRVPPADHPTYARWKQATQEYQALVVRRQIEELRRLKYRPTGGFAQFCFADGHPAVTWSVLDHERRPKAGYAALREACRPVIVVADRLPAQVVPGDRLDLAVHVVSDLRTSLDGTEVTARLAWSGGERSWRFGGDTPADSCVRIGRLDMEVPEAPGPLELALAVVDSGGATIASNTDSSVIRAS